jgi:hypothetical protein
MGVKEIGYEARIGSNRVGIRSSDWLLHIHIYGSENLGSIKDDEFLDPLCEYQLLKDLRNEVTHRAYILPGLITMSKKSKGHSSNCAATYNVELRQLSLFHGTF